jgi:hypothetical protein
MPVKRLRSHSVPLFALVVGIASACSVDEEAAAPLARPAAPTSSDDASQPPAGLGSSEAAGARGDSADPQSTRSPTDHLEGPELPPPPARPLEDLLRLPAPIAEEHIGNDRLTEPGEGDEDATTDQERREGSIGVEIERQEDPVGFEPARSHSRTDAGVSVGVDEKTRLRGGVRVEPEQEREEPVPTVGIEQKF